MNIFEPAAAVQEHVLQLDRYLRRVHTQDQTEPFSDRESSGHLKQFDMGRGCRIVYGKVVDAIAYCHWYKVQPEGAKTVIPCCMLSGLAMTPFGVREHNQLQPNAKVYILLHPVSPYGAIIGVEPPHMFDAQAGLSDYISMSSRNGVQVDDVHRFPFTLPRLGTIVDWSAGRPTDGTTAGEMGWFAESGVGVFLDSAMAFLRADENCGVWAIHRDQLLRLAGHNMQLRSGGMEWECLDDQGEFSVTQGYTPYPYEQLGGLAPGQTLHRTLTVEQSQIEEPHYNRFEPLYDDQQPFHRTRHHYGYLGQGGKRMVVAPPTGGTVNRYSDRSVAPGLFNEQVALTGQHTIQTAKGFRVVKRLIAPVPKQVQRPESLTGDTPDNYKAAGLQGGGPDHLVGEIQADPEDPGMNRIMGVLDAQAYGLNWEGLQPFSVHAADYFTPEEREIKQSLGASNISKIPFDLIAAGGRLPPQTPVPVRIDHRYGDVSYYPSCSYFELMDDGSDVIGDGYGSEMRMSGGDMILAPPGDLILQPGRRLIIMAGTDVIVRARNGIDLSATDRDVRIFSGGAAYVSGRGVMLEDRSDGDDFDSWRNLVGEDVHPTGIIMKSANASVTTWANGVYMRTGVNGGSGSGIILDSGKGEGRIITHSMTWDRYIGSSANDYFGTGDSVQSANQTSASSMTIGTQVVIKGAAFVDGLVLANGWFYSVNGHIATALAEEYKGLTATLKDESLDQAQQSMSDAGSNVEAARALGETTKNEVFTQGLYTDNAGDDQIIQEAAFSFRTETQYKTEDFRLYETRWQQLARIWNSSTQFWIEEPVVKSGETTYPFPGRQKTVEEEAFITQDLTLFDLEEGTAVDRSNGAYADPAFGLPQKKMLNESYRVF